MRADVNLSSAERGGRLRSAVIALGIALLIVVLLAEQAASPIWWAAVLPPLFLASLQVAQAYTGVCIYHARHGTRVTPDGEVEKILDPRTRSSVEARGRRVLGLAAAMASSATALVVGIAYLR